MIRITDIAQFSCVGPRANQEDYIVPAESDKDGRIFVVCDGMGGHGHGEVASKAIATAVYDYLTGLAAKDYTPEQLQDALDYAQTRLDAIAPFTANDGEKAPGTTLVVCAVNPMNLLIGHVGDSRAYLFDSDGVKKFRSHDHSKVQEAVDAEILTEEEAFNSPKKNLITRCVLAGSPVPKVEVDTLTVENGDRLLLCTDGVNDAMRDNVIQSMVASQNVADALEMIRNECGLLSHDNHTALLVSFSQDEKNPEPVVPESEKPAENSSDEPDGDGEGFCRFCGHKLPENAGFCPGCGAPVNSIDNDRNTTPTPPPYPTPRPMPGKPIRGTSFLDWLSTLKKPWMLGMVFLAIVMVAACSFGAFARCSHKTTIGSQDPKSSTEQIDNNQTTDSQQP